MYLQEPFHILVPSLLQMECSFNHIFKHNQACKDKASTKYLKECHKDSNNFNHSKEYPNHTKEHSKYIQEYEHSQYITRISKDNNNKDLLKLIFLIQISLHRMSTLGQIMHPTKLAKM